MEINYNKKNEQKILLLFNEIKVITSLLGKKYKGGSYKTPFIKLYATLPSSQLMNNTIAV